ncbi:MAG: hypothetical protein V4492_09625 [Chlamydiota bacterium]
MASLTLSTGKTGTWQSLRPATVLVKSKPATQETKLKVWLAFQGVKEEFDLRPSMQNSPVSAWVNDGLEHLQGSWRWSTNGDLYDHFSGVTRHLSYFFGRRFAETDLPNPHALPAKTHASIEQLDQMFTAMVR